MGYGGKTKKFCCSAEPPSGRLYEGKVKTEASRDAIPVPEDIRPVIEAWRQLCPDVSPEALMFPTFGRHSCHGTRSGKNVPRQAKNFLKWRIWPIADKLGIPRKLVTFQVMRRTLGTDLQRHGTMKDAQQILRHASIRTTANVYMQQIPASVVAAINSRTRAILAAGREVSGEIRSTTGSNLKRGFVQVLKKNGSSGRTRTYNPPVNSRMIRLGVHTFSMTYTEQRVVFGAPAAHNVSQNVSQIFVQAIVH